MPSALRLLFLALTLSALPFAARADVLQLANGDTLQGRLLSRDAGMVRWENPILGVVTVPADRAAIIAETQSPPANTASGSTTPAASASNQGTVTIATSAASISPANPAPVAPRWQTKIESGFALQSGRADRVDINLRAESSLKSKRNDYRIQARYFYSKANDAVTTDRTEAAFRWRRDLDQHWFGQTNSSYLAAKVKGIDHNLEQNVGLGYNLIKGKRTTASLGAGFTGQYREVSDAGTGQSLFGEIFQDFAIKLTPRLDLGQDFTAQYSPSGRGIRILPGGAVQIINTDVTNYKLALNAFLRGKLTEALSLALRYEYEYDNTYVNDSEKTDQRVTTTLGYSF